MKRYINKFATRADIKTALSNKELYNPYVAYIEDEQVIDWNSKQATVPNNEIWFSIDGTSVPSAQYRNKKVFPTTGWGANLVSVNWDGNDCVLKFDGDVTKIPAYGLAAAENGGQGQPEFTYIAIPETVTEFGEGALYYAYFSTAQPNLFRNATKIGRYAFWYGYSMNTNLPPAKEERYLIFGENLQSIAGYFDGNSAVQDMIFLGENAPVMPTSSSIYPVKNIYIPDRAYDDGAMSSYVITQGWGQFLSKIKPMRECPYNI